MYMSGMYYFFLSTMCSLSTYLCASAALQISPDLETVIDQHVLARHNRDIVRALLYAHALDTWYFDGSKQHRDYPYVLKKFHRDTHQWETAPACSLAQLPQPYRSMLMAHLMQGYRKALLRYVRPSVFNILYKAFVEILDAYHLPTDMRYILCCLHHVYASSWSKKRCARTDTTLLKTCRARLSSYTEAEALSLVAPCSGIYTWYYAHPYIEKYFPQTYHFIYTSIIRAYGLQLFNDSWYDAHIVHGGSTLLVCDNRYLATLHNYLSKHDTVCTPKNDREEGIRSIRTAYCGHTTPPPQLYAQQIYIWLISSYRYWYGYSKSDASYLAECYKHADPWYGSVEYNEAQYDHLKTLLMVPQLSTPIAETTDIAGLYAWFTKPHKITLKKMLGVVRSKTHSHTRTLSNHTQRIVTYLQNRPIPCHRWIVLNALRSHVLVCNIHNGTLPHELVRYILNYLPAYTAPPSRSLLWKSSR